jgi:arginine decarboxylase
VMLSGGGNRTVHVGSRLLEGAYQLDQSTSVGDLGSLFVWQGDKPVQQLKRRLADAYGAIWSFPSTHGTTILNTLALLTACPPGGRVLINRDAHSSVTAAMIQGGLEPVYLVPEYDAALGLTLGPSLAAFDQLLDRTTVDCVFLTSPNYFGVVGELAAIIASAKRRGLPVVVDAAHAPHFHFCRALPAGAEDLGADLVTQSTHKVASALSQGSLLLIRDERFIEPLYAHVNELGLVSTSFSYPILASVELAIHQLVVEGDTIWSDAIVRAERLRRQLRHIPGATCFGVESIGRAGFSDLDRTRVTLNVAGAGLTGFELERRLNEQHVYPEMATFDHVLFLVTPGTRDSDLTRLGHALQVACNGALPSRRPVAPSPPPVPEMAVIPRAAKFAKKRTVPLAQAAGEVAGETIATYPPGAPILTLGEVISRDVIDYLSFMRSHGAVLKGPSDAALHTIKVLA